MTTFSDKGSFQNQGWNNPLGAAFLSALVGLIQLVTQEYISDSHSFNFERAAVQEVNGGQELLSALEKFIKSTVKHYIRKEESHTGHIQDDTETNAESLTTTGASMLGLYSPTVTIDVNLPSSLIEEFRRYVFNKMPIRLLTFDSKGENIRLIERNEVLSHVLHTARHAVLTEESAANRCYEPVTSTTTSDFIRRMASYAILSHTWIRDTPGDVVLRDWDTRSSNARGNSKITDFCRVAAIDYGIRLAWMDTVCINKDSSSELDESIRSMYKWYREAHICMAYLVDTVHLDQMAKDSWFTRGWTLQELLAPRDIQFYNSQWLPLRNPARSPNAWETLTTITAQITYATTITERELECFRIGHVHLIPMSRKMQLGANRRVTRGEDTAYSMMGILGVDISIAYGEGSERAFSRLVQAFLTTQKNTLDVFNHSLNDSLIPTSITQYANRSSRFDDETESSVLDKHQLGEPILVTHLGVRVQVLIICAIRTPFFEQLPGYQDVGPLMTVDLPLSNDTIEYTTNYTTSYHRKFVSIVQAATWQLHKGSRSAMGLDILHLGILNIHCIKDEVQGLISMPGKKLPALTLPMTVDTSHFNSIVPSNSIYSIQKTARSVIFDWTGPEIIRLNELEKHGMRFETIYL